MLDVAAVPGGHAPSGAIRLVRQVIGGLDPGAAQEVWESGLCAQTDPELFFPEQGQYEQARAAKAVCGRCPVRELCLDTFGDLVAEGIVGGLTARERLVRRRERRVGEAAA